MTTIDRVREHITNADQRAQTSADSTLALALDALADYCEGLHARLERAERRIAEHMDISTPEAHTDTGGDQHVAQAAQWSERPNCSAEPTLAEPAPTERNDA